MVFPVGVNCAKCGGKISGVVGRRVCVTRSRSNVHLAIGAFLRDRNCTISSFPGNSLLCSTFLSGRPSLIVLSIVVPKSDNFRVAGGVHSVDSIPVVVLATGSDSVSCTANVGLNDSSCFAGPFDTVTLGVHMGTVLHHVGVSRRHLPTHRRRTALQVNSVRVSLTTVSIGRGKISLGLAPGRCGIFICLVRGGGHTISESRLLSSV